MKKLTSLILITSLLTGCASQQLYNIPSGKTKADFIVVREDCTRTSGYGDGSFLFGPIIIIFPLAIIMAVIKHNQQKDFETCMVAQGYQCSSGCLNTEQPSDNIKLATQPESIPYNINKIMIALSSQGFSDYYVTPNKEHFMVNKDSIIKDGNLYTIKLVSMYDKDKSLKVKLTDSVTYSVAYQTSNYTIDIKDKRFKLTSFTGYDRNDIVLYSHVNSDMETVTGDIMSTSALDRYLKMYVPDFSI